MNAPAQRYTVPDGGQPSECTWAHPAEEHQRNAMKRIDRRMKRSKRKPKRRR